MPENLFLLFPLLGGFIFTSKWNKTKWYSARWEKERLLLNSAVWGGVFTFIAYLLIILPDHLPAWLTCSLCLPRWPMHMSDGRFLGLALLSLVLGTISWIPANRFWKWTNQLERLIETEGTLLDQMSNSSLKEQKTVMITLKGGKVYAGFITSSTSPGTSRPTIRLLPTKSGYRDRKSHRVVFTTPYSQALDEIADDIQQRKSQMKALSDQIQELEKINATSQTKEAITKANSAPASETSGEELNPEALKEQLKLIDLQCVALQKAVDDFGVLIPVDEISSMTFYHADIHTKYFARIEKQVSKQNRESAQ
jgi:hypothetical protein